MAAQKSPRSRARSTAKKRSGAAKRTSSNSPARAGDAAFNRIGKSLDATQRALRDMRADMGKSSRALVKDVEKALKEARRDMEKANVALRKDLEKLQRAVIQGRTTPKRPARGKATAKKAGAKKTTAKKAGAKKTSAKRSTTRKPAASRSR